MLLSGEADTLKREVVGSNPARCLLFSCSFLRFKLSFSGVLKRTLKEVLKLKLKTIYSKWNPSCTA